MKIQENFIGKGNLKGIFHHDKSNKMKVDTCIYLGSIFSRF